MAQPAGKCNQERFEEHLVREIAPGSVTYQGALHEYPIYRVA